MLPIPWRVGIPTLNTILCPIPIEIACRYILSFRIYLINLRYYELGMIFLKSVIYLLKIHSRAHLESPLLHIHQSGHLNRSEWSYKSWKWTISIWRKQTKWSQNKCALAIHLSGIARTALLEISKDELKKENLNI